MLHVGFWFDFGLKYAGGLNYFRNLLYAIHQVRPEGVRTTLFIGKDLPPVLEEEFRRVTDVVKLDLLTRGTRQWFIHRLLYRGFRSQQRMERILRKFEVDVVSHPSMVERLSERFRLISWIPDFQYLHLPHLFPGLDIEKRSADLRMLHRHSDAVVLSSQDAYKDFAALTGEARPARTHVLPFVSQLHMGEMTVEDARVQRERFDLPERYIFLPNQFWAHKNHRTAFEAVARLKQEGVKVTLVCTGWIKDPKASSRPVESLQVIEVHGLQDQVKLLGSIAYADVLGLMRNSVAVLNPSFFEGWSSSVEESKSMGKRLIASDLAVHREQAHPKAVYFDPNHADELAAVMKQAWLEWPAGISPADESTAQAALDRRTVEFGQRYLQILREAVSRDRTAAPR